MILFALRELLVRQEKKENHQSHLRVHRCVNDAGGKYGCSNSDVELGGDGPPLAFAEGQV